MEGSARDLYPSRDRKQGRILPRHDPVVASAQAPGPLSPPKLLQYQHHGYLQFDEVFSPAQIARVERATSDLLRSDFVLRRPETVRDDDTKTVQSIFRPQAFSPILEEVVCDARLRAIAQQILGTPVYVHQSRVNHKPAFTGKESFWRADFECWHVEDGLPRMRALNMIVGVSTYDEFTGPLMFIPGSHRQFVACSGEGPESPARGQPSLELLAKLAHENGIATPRVKPGAIVVFDANLMHAVGRNLSPFPHYGISIAYNSSENGPVAPYGGRAPRPDYIAHRDVAAALQ